MREMKLKRLCLHQSELTLEDVEGRLLLPLRLAPLTVSYVAHELRSCDGGGIPTYHLIQTIVKVFGGKSVRGVIDAPLEGRPKGILVIGKEEDRLDFPCDPADAFTLAMKAGVPIYATREAIQAGGQLFDPHPLQGGLETSRAGSRSSSRRISARLRREMVGRRKADLEIGRG